jgi:hypothetical protein
MCQRLHQLVAWGERRIGDVLVLEMDGVTEAFSFGALDVAVVNSVVVCGCVEVPTINTVGGPSAALVSFFMNLDFAAHRSQWHLVIVERATQVSVGRHCRCGVGLSEKVEGNLGLWEQAVPKTGRESGGDTCENTEEVRFEVPDGHFGCIATVATRGDKLDFKLVGILDVIFHVEGDFIIEDVFAGGYTGTDKALDKRVVGAYHLVVLPAVHGLE